MPETRLTVWPRSIKKLNLSPSELLELEPIRPITVSLQPGDIAVFRADLVHAGSSYENENIRIHGYLDTKAVPRLPNGTYIIHRHAPPELARLISFPCDADGKALQVRQQDKILVIDLEKIQTTFETFDATALSRQLLRELKMEQRKDLAADYEKRIRHALDYSSYSDQNILEVLQDFSVASESALSVGEAIYEESSKGKKRIRRKLAIDSLISSFMRNVER
jgi:hypothetical protein